MLRYRDSPTTTGLSLAAGTAIKLFVAPLALWFLFTGRSRAAITSAVSAVTMSIGAWAIRGYEGQTGYTEQLRANNNRFSRVTPLVQGLVQQAGGSQRAAIVVGLVVAIALVVAAWNYRHDDTASTDAWAETATTARPAPTTNPASANRRRSRPDSSKPPSSIPATRPDFAIAARVPAERDRRSADESCRPATLVGLSSTGMVLWVGLISAPSRMLSVQRRPWSMTSMPLRIASPALAVHGAIRAE